MWYKCPNHPKKAKFMGPTWGPPGADRTPWTLLSGINVALSRHYDNGSLIMWVVIGTLRTCGPYLHRPALVQIMAWRMFGARLLSEPMLTFCWWDLKERTLMKFEIKNKTIFIQENWFNIQFPKWLPLCLWFYMFRVNTSELWDCRISPISTLKITLSLCLCGVVWDNWTGHKRLTRPYSILLWQI